MKSVLICASLFASAALFAAEADPAAQKVNYVDSDHVTQVLGKGGTMIDGSDFAVQGTHRVKPGNVEIHLKETDVFYVTDGEATVVTGGTVQGRHETRANQVGGTAIEGGETFHLKKGDVMTIPAGVPHWFKETNGISYYVVKVKKP